MTRLCKIYASGAVYLEETESLYIIGGCEDKSMQNGTGKVYCIEKSEFEDDIENFELLIINSS